MISPSTIDKLNELSLVDVVKAYVPDLKKKGANHSACCPFHNEKSPSFSVNEVKNVYKCFGCGKGGNTPINFAMDKTGLPFVDAVKDLAGVMGVTIEYENWSEEKAKAYEAEQKVKKRLTDLLNFSAQYYLANGVPEAWTKARSFDEKHLKWYSLGSAKDDWHAFYNAAKAQGFDDTLLVKSGLVKKSEEKGNYYDAYRNRIIFPIYDQYGQVIAFTGRVINDQDQPKYINSPDSLWEKGKHLYGLHLCKKGIEKQGKAYLVEGQTDVIRCHFHGIPAVAPGGTALTHDQAKLLKCFTDTVVIMPDNDMGKKENSGIEAMHRNAKVLLENNIHVKTLIPGK